MKWPFCIALLGLFCLVGSLKAVELSQDFDSGSLNVAASSINGNTIHLVGRKTWTKSPYNTEYRWVYFKASGVTGLQPFFEISAAEFLGDLTDHRFLYSYDQSQWNYFDNGYIDMGDYNYHFSNNQAFTQDEVYVAYSLPYPLSRTEQHIATVSQSSYVQTLTSGNGTFVVGQTAGGIDDLGRTISPNNLYGFKITDPTVSGTKMKVLLAGGNHACETPGSHALEGMIDFLLSDSLEAVRLRGLAEFFVYPQVNPDGREAGYYRSSVENPSKDYNRYWHDPTGMTDMTAVRDAMILDTGGDLDYLFDFHSMFGAWSRPPYYETQVSCAYNEFCEALAELEPGIEKSVKAGFEGMLRVWGMMYLHAENSYTPEFGCHPGVLEAELDAMGANYARALYRALVPTSMLLPGDATDDGIVDEADLAVLAEHWGESGANWWKGDFDDDGLVGPSDASILAANWGNISELLSVPEPVVLLHFAVGAIFFCLTRRLGRPL